VSEFGSEFTKQRPVEIELMLNGKISNQFRTNVVALLECMFPVLEGILPESDHAQSWHSSFSLRQWQTSRRIASEELFDAYFQRGLEDSVIRSSEIEQIQGFLESGDADGFGIFFKNLNAQPVVRSTISRAFLALERCQLTIGQFGTLKDTLPYVETLLEVGDEIGNSKYFLDQRGFHEHAANTIAILAFKWGLQEQEGKRNGDMILEKLKDSRALFTAIVTASLIDLERKRQQQPELFVTAEFIEKTKEILLARLKNEQDIFLDKPILVRILLPYWKWLSGDAIDAQHFAERVLARNAMQILMITSYGSRYGPVLEPDPDQLWGINKDFIKEFIDLKQLRDRAVQYAKGEHAKFVGKYFALVDQSGLETKVG
jgi:hypothetical protein